MREIPFALSTEFIELYKLLKATGLCESGGAAKHAISQGEVKVDGVVELRKARKILKGQSVAFEGQIILAK